MVAIVLSGEKIYDYWERKKKEEVIENGHYMFITSSCFQVPALFLK